ncbi:MAG: hypothetical protein INR68_13870 [Methylobacterium mesophilicum]|nr:hypothetical protein [Methylobacterium mesophilicum]
MQNEAVNADTQPSLPREELERLEALRQEMAADDDSAARAVRIANERSALAKASRDQASARIASMRAAQQSPGQSQTPSAGLSPDELQRLEALRQELAADEPSTAGAIAGDIGTGLKEAPGQMIRGAAQAINETSNTTYGMAEWLNDNVMDLGTIRLGSDSANGWVDWVPGMPDQNNLKVPEAVIPGEAASNTGKLVEGVSQFATGFVIAGRYLKSLGFTAATAQGTMALGMAKGAIADATAFDPHEERLSNLIESFPSLSNPVTDFLSAKEDDGEAMGRFKNALEGLGLGAAVEVVGLSLRALRATRAGNPEEVAKVIDELDAKAPPEAAPFKEPEQIEMDLPGGGPGKDSPREAVEENPTADAPPLKAGTPAADKPVKKLVEVDDKKLESLIIQRHLEDKFGDGESISGIRTDLIENGEDVVSVMNSLRTVYQSAFDKATGGNADGVRTWAAVRTNVDRLADIIQDNPKLLMQRMSAQTGNLKNLDAETRMYADVLTTVSNKVYDLAEKVADPRGGLYVFKDRVEMVQSLAKNWELLGNIEAQYKGMQTNIARSMNAMKMGGRIRKDLGAVLDPDELFDGGMAGVERLARRVVAGGKNPKNVLASTRGGFASNAVSSVNEYWINAILSGPKTHLVNVGTSLLNSAFIPVEKMLAGALRGGTSAGRQQMLEAGLQYAGMVASFRDAVKLAGKAFKLGDGILDPSNTSYELRNAISSVNYGVTDPALAASIDGLGTVVRMSSRFLTTEDEFIKQLNYRGQVRAKAYREAFTKGLWKDPKAFSAYVEDALDGSVNPAGRALDTRMLEQARTVTFTNDLKASTLFGKRTLGENFQRWSEDLPALRLIMPFIRTPTNIMRFAWNRTPGLNMLRNQYFRDFAGKNGPEARAQAQAMMATGTALWATAISYASDGTITGAGPRDPDIKRMLRDTGWQPYSFRTVNEDGSVTYTAYDRTDPFGMFFGLAADYSEVMGYQPDQTLEEFTTAAGMALAKNLTNKSYLSGLTKALNAFSEPDRNLSRYGQNFVGSFIPAVVTQTLRDDPYMREVRSVMDAIHARTPGYSDTIDPVRNVLGEKVVLPPAWGPDFISPIAQNTNPGGAQPLTEEWKQTVQSNVSDELARQMFLENSAIRPPPRQSYGVDFTAFRSSESNYTAYDRWQELTGTVKIGGKTLYETLEKTINSPAYRGRATDGNADFGGSRADVLRAIIGGYRKKAESELRKEIPELDLAVRQGMHQAAMTRVKQKQAAQ